MISDGIYTYLKETSIDKVKEIIDSILALTGNDSKWSDYFDIYEDFDDYYVEDLYNEECDEYTNPTREELLDFIHRYNEEHFDNGDSIITWITVEPLIDEADEAAELLNSLNYLFDLNYNNE